MKTAGVALSVIGSILAIICALIFLSASVLMDSSSFPIAFYSSIELPILQIMTTALWLSVVLLLICVFLGIIGAVKMNKKGTVSGTLLVIAAVLSAMTIYGAIPAFCFVISGIFAFVSDKRSVSQPEAESKDSDEGEYDLGL